jgi:chaperone modulatory protein CbpM
MIGMDILVTEVAGLRRPDILRWIDNDWVRPRGVAGAYLFMEIDVARIRLLRDELNVDETALPVVLLLLDQLHDLRRRMRELGTVIERTVPSDIRETLMLHLTRSGPE